MPVKVGELVAERYELEERVGSGGMSSVYRARDTVLERRVALKILHEHYSRDAEYVERFRREARAIAKLTHPNIVTVIDRGEWEGHQFIVFEHVPGENLAELLEAEGRLPVERALLLTHQVARGLAFAHEFGIVHRDVKPQNVLIDGDGAAKVTDFGIARSLEIDDELTQTGTLLGTGDYLSPEQASGEAVDERSDQYSLGVLLYELLAGEVPYPAPNVMSAAMRHLRDPVPSVRAVRPDVPQRVDAIVARAMQKRPDDRFPSTEAMTAALEAALADERAARRAGADEDTGVIAPVPVAPVPRRRPPPARRRAGRRWPLLAALVLLAAVSLVVGLLLARADGNELGGLVPGGDGGDGGGGGGGSGAQVSLEAVSDFDPRGDDTEHPEAVPAAADGDPATFWTTETYQDFTATKPGVGIVLDAGSPVALSGFAVTSDTPRFTAVVRAGTAEGGPFEAVSDELQAGARTDFEVDTGGEEYRYYLLWITDLDSVAHVNEVRATSSE
jgi:tRNA A-37 threonylcarbamoyl transferase component Bud32